MKKGEERMTMLGGTTDGGQPGGRAGQLSFSSKARRQERGQARV